MLVNLNFSERHALPQKASDSKQFVLNLEKGLNIRNGKQSFDK